MLCNVVAFSLSVRGLATETTDYGKAPSMKIRSLAFAGVALAMLSIAPAVASPAHEQGQQVGITAQGQFQPVLQAPQSGSQAIMQKHQLGAPLFDQAIDTTKSQQTMTVADAGTSLDDQQAPLTITFTADPAAVARHSAGTVIDLTTKLATTIGQADQTQL